MMFSGCGSVRIIGNANDGSGVDSRYFNNINLTGDFLIEGTSKSGPGVNLNSELKVNLNKATITGVSGSSTGVNIVTADGADSLVNLGDNKITGISESGAGIIINGNNVTITNGSLTGNATSGSGAGISLNGGSNYTLDGVTVKGTSVDGVGVFAGGKLTVNNGTSVSGTSTGVGSGIKVTGALITTSGDGVSLSGEADSGDGIRVNGATSLNNATVNG